jgi:hypothetical protein
MPGPATPLDTAFIPFLTVAWEDRAALRGALLEIRAGRLGGVVLRGVYGPDAIAGLNRRLDEGGHRFARTPLPGFEGQPVQPFLYGRSIVGADPDLAPYFDAATRTADGLRWVFDEAGDLEARLQEALTVLSDGLPSAVPVGAAGHPYAPATVRELPDGHEIGLHIGNAFLCMPQAQDLAARVDVGAQISWFLPLQRPQAGGELVIYDLRWDAVKDRYQASTDSVRQTSRVNHALMELLPRVAVDPAEGDLLIFDGGRFFHRVAPARGPRPRRTVGGFLAWRLDETGLSYWS